jgi:hypothetical protein
MAFRTSWFDVVGRALPPGDEPAVARAIERLSGAFRAGSDALGYEDAPTRAAYLWHHLPAHVCDLTTLLLDVAELWAEREALALVALGAGPGSEVLALGEALTRKRERGEETAVRRVRAARVDRVGGWDASFVPLLEAAQQAWDARDPARADPAEGWSLQAAPAALPWDVCAAPPSPEVRGAVAEADLVVLSNLLTELPPRGSESLPDVAAAGFAALLAQARAGSAWLVLDRAGAPGAVERIDALIALAAAGPNPPRAVHGPRARQIRCGCALTRRAKALYEQVHLPTTRVEDRPARNCHTAWCALVW